MARVLVSVAEREGLRVRAGLLLCAVWHCGQKEARETMKLLKTMPTDVNADLWKLSSTRSDCKDVQYRQLERRR